MDTPERNSENAAPKRRLNASIVAAGVAFGITLAGLGVAAAQTDGGDATTSTTAAPSDTTSSTEATTVTPAAPETSSSTAAPAQSGAGSGTDTTPVPAPKTRGPRVAETELTGEVADKVRAAALAGVPGGTIIRVETDSDGSPYEAHVRKADGTEVVVKVDADFAVTGIEEGRRGGHRSGHRGGPGGAPATLAGEAADNVTSAALAAVPGGTIVRVQAGPGDGYHAHITKADGTEVVVTLDAEFNVTGSVDGATYGGGHHGPRPGHMDAEDSETD